MNNLILFTDVGVDVKTCIGFGAYLAIETIGLPASDLIVKVKVKHFENTSSTVLELQTLLWAINDALPPDQDKPVELTIYTDSQNVSGLIARRKNLERREYYANNGRRLKNAEIYQHFYHTLDRYAYQIIKVKGHKAQHEKNDIDKIFTLVDRASRLALRNFRREKNFAMK